jgi:peptide/nickel transport system substrate-binding protein
MTVKLRSGIFWSDGVEFTSADAVFTTELHMKTNGMRWSAPFQINVASVSAPDRNTVVFKLKKPNSRFHALFTVRWNAVWMMPKHVFEKVADPLKFDFNKPVSLGLHCCYDPNGMVHLAMRDDWQRTTLSRFSKPGLKTMRGGPRPARQARDRANEHESTSSTTRRRKHVHAGEAVETSRG